MSIYSFHFLVWTQTYYVINSCATSGVPPDWPGKSVTSSSLYPEIDSKRLFNVQEECILSSKPWLLCIVCYATINLNNLYKEGCYLTFWTLKRCAKFVKQNPNALLQLQYVFYWSNRAASVWHKYASVPCSHTQRWFSVWHIVLWASFKSEISIKRLSE